MTAISASGLRGAMVKIMPALFMAAVPTLASAAVGNAAVEDEEGGSYITFAGEGMFTKAWHHDGDFCNDYQGSLTDFRQSGVGALGVDYYMYCCGNDTPEMEIGFYTATSEESRLIITGYSDENGNPVEPRYVESVEIAWNDIPTYCDGALTLFGKRGGNERAFSSTDKYSKAVTEYDEKIDASKEDGAVSKYTFRSPVNFLAVYNYRGDGELGDSRSKYASHIAAVKYIKLHFTSTPPSTESTGVEAVIPQSGAEEYFDLSGRRVNPENIRGTVLIRKSGDKVEKIIRN